MDQDRASAAGTTTGRRSALVVACSEYADPALRELRAPAGDALALRDLLADPDIGAFDVTSVVDQDAKQIRLAIEEFLVDRSPADLLVVYISCHGLVDLRRRLYFAARDTLKNRLAASAVEAHWLLDQLEECRARSQVVILDCCFSGAFAQGAKGDGDLALGERLLGQGRGRVVLTASRSTEYSFEGESLDGEESPGSVFTNALVTGIRSGAADADGDGFISVDDAYAYAFDHVRELGTNQTPQRWLYGAEGGILLARNPRSAAGEPLKRPTPVPVAAEPRRTPVAPARSRRPTRAMVYAAAGVLVVAAVVVTLTRLLGGSPSGTSSADGHAGFTSGAFTTTGPWRLVVRNNRETGSCDLSLKNTTTGTKQDWTSLDGDLTFQVAEKGAFRWDVNDPGCVVVHQAGPNELPLPVVMAHETGDSDAFRPGGKVLATAVDMEGSTSCELQLDSVATGQAVALGALHKGAGPVVLDPGGEPLVYLERADCKVRISEAP